MSKKRILFFPFDLLSHYLRCIALAKKCYAKEDYDIYFVSSRFYNHYVLENGYLIFDCETFDSDYVMQCSAKFNFSWLNKSSIENIFLAQRKIIQALKPDYVIGDVAPTLKMAATAKGVPYISLLNAYMTKYYTLVRSISRTHPLQALLKIFPSSIANYFISIGEAYTFRKIHEPFRTIRKKYNLPPIKDYLSEMEGDENLICDTSFLFPQKQLPKNYRFIGPLFYEHISPQNEGSPTFSKQKPIIAISMGSTGNWEALNFLNHDYYNKYSIITAGDSNKVLTASHIRAYDFLNLELLIGQSDLFIFHGGNGSLYYGLQAGVYMLAFTSNFEQEWNVQALTTLGYGESANDFNENQWKDAIIYGIRKKLNPILLHS